MRYSVDVSVSFGSLDPKAREKLADLSTINPSISTRGITELETANFYADYTLESDATTLEDAEKEAMNHATKAIAATGITVDEVWVAGTYDNDRGVWLSEY
jgi:hypothetical protein